MHAPSKRVPGTASQPRDLEAQVAAPQGVKRKEPRDSADNDQGSADSSVRAARKRHREEEFVARILSSCNLKHKVDMPEPTTVSDGDADVDVSGAPPIHDAAAAAAVDWETGDMTEEQMEGDIHTVPTLEKKLKRLRRKQKEIVSAITKLRQRGDDIKDALDELIQTFLRHTKQMRQALRRALRG